MASDDVSTTIVTLTKRPISRKHRILSHSQSTRKNSNDDFRINRTLTATNRSSSKLPNILSKASIYPSTPDAMQFRRYRSQQKDILTSSSSSSKIEQQSTISNSPTGLPIFYTLTSDSDKKRACDLQRRQIYALNHLMRELEQEQFRQFCKLHNFGNENHVDIVKNDENTNKQSLT